MMCDLSCELCGEPGFQVDADAILCTRCSDVWAVYHWECERCGKLFWHGSHWERIAEQLRGLGLPGAPSA